MPQQEIEYRKQNKILLLLEEKSILNPSQFFRCPSCSSYINYENHNIFLCQYMSSTNYSNYDSFYRSNFICIFCASRRHIKQCLVSYARMLRETIIKRKFAENFYLREMCHYPGKRYNDANGKFSSLILPSLVPNADTQFYECLQLINKCFIPDIYLFTIDGKPYKSYPECYWSSLNDHTYSTNEILLEIQDENDKKIHKILLVLSENS